MQNKNNRPTNKPNVWMTKDAMTEQKTLKKARSAFLKTPHDLNRRSFYLNLKKKFKSLFQTKRTHEMMNMGGSGIRKD